MPTLNDVIQNIVVGNSILLTRTLTGIDPLDGLATVVMNVKRYVQDVDGSAIFKKTITTASVAGQGQITATGATASGNGTASIILELTSANTGRLVPNVAYYFDITGKTAAGAIYTGDSGLFIGTSRISIAIP